MGNLGAPELILILLVIVVFFGAKKIPESLKVRQRNSGISKSKQNIKKTLPLKSLRRSLEGIVLPAILRSLKAQNSAPHVGNLWWTKLP